MCDPIVGTIISAIGAVTGFTQQRKADKRAEQANDIAKTNAEKALRQQQDEINRKPKTPNIAALLASNTGAAKSPTLLSGNSGVSSGQLALGQNKILGN